MTNAKPSGNTRKVQGVWSHLFMFMCPGVCCKTGEVELGLVCFAGCFHKNSQQPIDLSQRCVWCLSQRNHQMERVGNNMPPLVHNVLFTKFPTKGENSLKKASLSETCRSRTTHYVQHLQQWMKSAQGPRSPLLTTLRHNWGSKTTKHTFILPLLVGVNSQQMMKQKELFGFQAVRTKKHKKIKNTNKKAQSHGTTRCVAIVVVVIITVADTGTPFLTSQLGVDPCFADHVPAFWWLGIIERDPVQIGNRRDYKWLTSGLDIPSTDQFWENRYVSHTLTEGACGYISSYDTAHEAKFYDKPCSESTIITAFICEW